MSKAAFEYSAEQNNLRRINSRMNGLRINPIVGGDRELERLQMAWDDVRTRISDADYAAMVAHESRVLTPAEQAAEAKALAERMAENRDKPSI